MIYHNVFPKYVQGHNYIVPLAFVCLCDWNFYTIHTNYSFFANGYHIGMITKWLVYIHENVEPVLSLVPQCKGSGIAQVVETSNAESPTPVYVYRKPFDNER